MRSLGRNNEYTSTNNDIISKLELVMMDYTHFANGFVHTHTQTDRHWSAGIEPLEISACAKIQPTFCSLMKIKARTHYGGDVNTLFCQPVSVDVCGFHGDREDAEERVQSHCSPITGAVDGVNFMIINFWEGDLFFPQTAIKKEAGLG